MLPGLNSLFLHTVRHQNSGWWEGPGINPRNGAGEWSRGMEPGNGAGERNCGMELGYGARGMEPGDEAKG